MQNDCIPAAAPQGRAEARRARGTPWLASVEEARVSTRRY